MKRILYVDDEKDFLELLEMALDLEDEDYDLQTFSTHSGALNYLTTHDVDLAFFDWRMSEGNASDFKVKAGSKLDGVRSYIITGELELELPQGFISIINKPFQIDELLDLIKFA